MNGSEMPGLGGMTLALTDAVPLETTVRWIWYLPLWSTVLLAIGAVFWIAAIYRRENSPAGKRIRTLLTLMRVMTVALLMFMIAQPVQQWYHQSKPRLVVLADESGSMDTRDVAVEGQDVTRREAWQKVLTEAEGSLLDDWRESFELEVLTFAEEFRQVERDAGNGKQNALSDQVDAATDGNTRLGDAVLYSLRELPGPIPSAIVVFTDGISNRGQSLQAAAERARAFHVPLHAVALGSEQRRPDVLVEDLLVEELVFPGDRLQVEASVKAVSLQGEVVSVQLRNTNTSETLAQTTVELPPEGASRNIRLSFRPEQPGSLPLELIVESHPTEADIENNVVRQSIEVHDRQIRVLLAYTSPSYEFRALKSLLERDPVVDLKVHLQEADTDFTEIDSTALSQFPLQAAELLSYDVVLLGDVDPRLLPRSVWPLLQEFVVEQGGGLACIAGPRFMPMAFQGNSSMELLFPFVVSQINPLLSQNSASLSYEIYPTALGWQAPSLQLGNTLPESETIWRNLPPVFWLLEIGRLKPGAQVLAEHPDRSGPGGFRLPVILRHFVGAGEVLFHATDESWRWRWQSDDRYFARYWGQVVRRLGRGRLAAGREGVLVSADRKRYQPGEDVRLQVRFRNAAQAPADDQGVVVQLQAADGRTREMKLLRRLGMRGVFESTVTSLTADSYEVLLLRPDFSGEVPSAKFAVQSPPRELARVAVDRRALSEAAELTGGGVYVWEDLEELSRALPRSQIVNLGERPPRPLWNTHFVLALFVLLLGSEWTLRRRYGML